jgi:putative metallohydrolase (TIGR04338 family)
MITYLGLAPLPRRKRRSSGPRDSQRGKVYKAEDSLPEMAESSFTSDAQVEKYARRVVGSRFVQKHWPKYRGSALVVRFRRAQSSTAYPGRNLLAFSRNHRSRLVVLHEVAHLLAPLGEKHGPGFVSIYLRLVRRFIGIETYKRLKDAFLKHKVKTRVTTKRVLTEQQRQDLRDRMATVRAAIAQQRSESAIAA